MDLPPLHCLKKQLVSGNNEYFLLSDCNSGFDPNSLEALAANALSAMRQGKMREALQSCFAALKQAPDNLAMLKLATDAATRLRDWRSVIRIGEQWRARYPGDPQAIRSLASAYFEVGDREKARDTYYPLVEANPESAEHLSNYSRLCLGTFDYDGAVAALEKALSLGAPSAESLYALARLKLFLGALDEAETLSAEAIRTDPDFAPAYAQYTVLRGGDVSERVERRMTQLATNDSLPAERQASLFFALGDISHRRKDYDRAMQAYRQGNQISSALIRAEGRAYDPAKFEQLRAREYKVFSTPSEGAAFEKGPARPIFVVGMPRSGTTLVESILAAHPDVYGAGELGAMPAIHNSVLAWAEADGGVLAEAPHARLQAWRDQYFAGYPDIKDARFVADKQPLNFRAAGIIKSLFPEAIIIHTRRNPVDTGFSIYRKDFGNGWSYAVSLDSIAHFYGEYARIVARWEKMLGPAFPLFQYEALIADFETQARRLIDLCGLDWREECLEFHRVERPIATFSSIQVRQPVRKIVAHAQDKYGDLLKPLVDGLERAGVDLETGALNAE